jgi:hypothetical protein
MANNPLINWANSHPRIAAWIVLAVGMVALLLFFGWNVGLSAGNWTALIIATVAVAGLCIWIISWEDDGEEAAEASPVSTPDAPKADEAEAKAVE